MRLWQISQVQKAANYSTNHVSSMVKSSLHPKPGTDCVAVNSGLSGHLSVGHLHLLLACKLTEGQHASLDTKG